MFNNKLQLILTLLCSSLTLSVLFNIYLSLEKQPANSFSTSSNIINYNGKSTANAFFQIGMSGFLDNESSEEACQNIGYKNQFCLQGYYFLKFKNDLYNQKQIDAPTQINQLLSLGQAYASMNIRSPDIASVLDGWSFYKTLYDSSFLSSFPNSCTEIAKNAAFAKYCFWGAGRAAVFLNKEQAEKIKNSNTHALAGYNFASILTLSVDDNSSSSGDISTLISKLALIFMEKSDVSDIPKCATNHPADCF